MSFQLDFLYCCHFIRRGAWSLESHDCALALLCHRLASHSGCRVSGARSSTCVGVGVLGSEPSGLLGVCRPWAEDAAGVCHSLTFVCTSWLSV